MTAKFRLIALLFFALVLSIFAPVALAQTKETRQFESVPLGQFALDRWQRIQVTLKPDGTGSLTLDPNRLSWDGYSPDWISTRMALSVTPIRTRELMVKLVPPATTGRLYDLVPVNRQPKKRLFSTSLQYRLLIPDDANAPARLLVRDAKGQIKRVITLERKSPSNTKPSESPLDAFFYRTPFLSHLVGNASFIKISGSLTAKTAMVTVDGNAVQLNAHGDPAISTMMAPIPQKVELVEKQLPKTVELGVRVFDLKGSKIPLTLVVWKNNIQAARLIVKDATGKATGFLVLEPDTIK